MLLILRATLELREGSKCDLWTSAQPSSSPVSGALLSLSGFALKCSRAQKHVKFRFSRCVVQDTGHTLVWSPPDNHSWPWTKQLPSADNRPEQRRQRRRADCFIRALTEWCTAHRPTVSTQVTNGPTGQPTTQKGRDTNCGQSQSSVPCRAAPLCKQCLTLHPDRS